MREAVINKKIIEMSKLIFNLAKKLSSRGSELIQKLLQCLSSTTENLFERWAKWDLNLAWQQLNWGELGWKNRNSIILIF